jgi:hypothetical protein
MMFFYIVLCLFVLYVVYKESNLNRTQFSSLISKGGRKMKYGKSKVAKPKIKKVKGKKKMGKKYGKA